MSSISREKVEHIAKLARIELTKEEIGKFQKELSSILDYVEQLNKVDTSKVEGISQVTGLKDVVRDDESRIMKHESRDKILKQAPQTKDNYFKVPKILE